MLKNLRDSELKEGDLVLNTKTSMAIRGKKKIHLTPQEFRLLEFMMRNKNNVLNRKLILNKVWLFSSEVDTRVVDVYIGYLKKN
jgi:DNA-binding response OmpR family regulator